MAEEEDGDIVDSWEDLEDNGELDKRLKDMKPKKKQNDRSLDGMTMPARPLEDTTRTPFTPQVKILKREPNANNASTTNSRPVAAKPMKTLEQREAEYAEARRRILGSDYVGGSPAGPGGVSEDTQKIESQQKLVHKLDSMTVSENIVRQPKGPDGSKGFNSNANFRR